MIKKTKKSQYYNPNWKVYICPSCGNEFYIKFEDSENCMFCQNHEEIQQKLEVFNHNQTLLNKQFKVNYIPKKKR